MEPDSILLSGFQKERHKILNLTQQQLAEKAGVGLRFIRDLEQGKTTLRMDKGKIAVHSDGSSTYLISPNVSIVLRVKKSIWKTCDNLPKD
jgi:hypothetical protein